MYLATVANAYMRNRNKCTLPPHNELQVWEPSRTKCHPIPRFQCCAPPFFIVRYFQRSTCSTRCRRMPTNHMCAILLPSSLVCSWQLTNRLTRLYSALLPAFYLLDAMSKNAYESYVRHFAPLVTGLFLETYQQVDQATRSKMEEMLLTWRTAIERGIWGSDSRVRPASKCLGYHHAEACANPIAGEHDLRRHCLYVSLTAPSHWSGPTSEKARPNPTTTEACA